MGRRLLDRTLQAAEQAVNDPDLHIHEDGSVWKRVGKPDKQGKRSVSYYMSRRPGHPNDYVSVPVHYLVWLKFNGPIPKGRFIIFRDRDSTNAELSNLALNGPDAYPSKLRRTKDEITFDEELAIKKDYANGMTTAQLRTKYSVYVTIIEDILGLPPSGRNRRSSTRSK